MADDLKWDDARDDRYFDLKGLEGYSGLNRSTLKRFMSDPVNPLPNHQLCASGKDKGRIVIYKREFDEWVRGFPPARGKRRVAKAGPRPDPRLAARVAAAVARTRGE